jgi:intracellular sulfur oxidation DsrE/DsrF family protein
MNPRRSFLTRFGSVAALLGFAAPSADAQSSAEGRFQPPREKLDDWYDHLPGKHRMFFDSVSPLGAQEAAMFANNFFTANKNGYGYGDADIAIVVGFRHNSIAFAFDDAIWSKYGAALSENAKFTDPRTLQVPTANLRTPALEALAKRGVHFAICDLSAHRIAGVIARKYDKTMEDVYKEMVPHAIGGAAAHFVPAGIVAVNRSQEHGYSIAYVG